jgi:Cyclin D1 binding domain
MQHRNITVVLSYLLISLLQLSNGYITTSIYRFFGAHTKYTTPLLIGGISTNIAETAFEPPEDSNDDTSSSTNNKRSGISSSEVHWTSGMSDTRRKRLESEEAVAKRFVFGDALHMLRQKVLGLRIKLQKAREKDDARKMNSIAQSILKIQQMDAEFIYQVSLERLEAASRAGLKVEAESYRQEALLARSALPQFNMGGLWIGRFGDEFQMVNVSYIGDTLVAHKVTGNKNIPKGEISFQVDLSPKSRTDVLQPIELNEESTKQWGRRFLQRFSGKGQVASSGSKQREWMDGQMILVDKYFSFAWLPIAHQVFFGRPSPELTLKLLRNNNRPSLESNKQGAVLSASTTSSSVEEMRSHLSRCWEETQNIQDELDVNDGIFKSNEQGYYYEQEGCFE